MFLLAAKKWYVQTILIQTAHKLKKAVNFVDRISTKRIVAKRVTCVDPTDLFKIQIPAEQQDLRI